MTDSSLSDHTPGRILIRFETPSNVRGDRFIGALIALTLFAGVAWFGQHDPVPAVKPVVKPDTIMLDWPVPPIEPDPPVATTNDAPKPVNVPPPPAQPDVPQPVKIDNFVQPLQPPAPNLPGVHQNTVTIPVHNTLRTGLVIFDPAQVDQLPVAVFQAKPSYPFELRHAGITGQVLVDFIVDSTGSVSRAFAVRSDDQAFEAAAVAAVSKWRFRPGRKAGVPVNTRMQVPIVFTLNDG